MIKRLFFYFARYRRDLIGSAVCVTAESVFELLIPLLMADIIDVGVIRHNRSYILQRSSLMIVCALIALALGALYARMAARAEALARSCGKRNIERSRVFPLPISIISVRPR